MEIGPCYSLCKIILFLAVLGTPFVSLLFGSTLSSHVVQFGAASSSLAELSLWESCWVCGWGPFPRVQLYGCFCEKHWLWLSTDLCHLAVGGVPRPFKPQTPVLCHNLRMMVPVFVLEPRLTQESPSSWEVLVPLFTGDTVLGGPGPLSEWLWAPCEWDQGLLPLAVGVDPWPKVINAEPHRPLGTESAWRFQPSLCTPHLDFSLPLFSPGGLVLTVSSTCSGDSGGIGFRVCCRLQRELEAFTLFRECSPVTPTTSSLRMGPEFPDSGSSAEMAPSAAWRLVSSGSSRVSGPPFPWWTVMKKTSPSLLIPSFWGRSPRLSVILTWSAIKMSFPLTFL